MIASFIFKQIEFYLIIKFISNVLLHENNAQQ